MLYFRLDKWKWGCPRFEKKLAFVVPEKENPMHLVKWLASGERFLLKNYYAIRKTSVG
jgi:hypothetical protein